MKLKPLSLPHQPRHFLGTQLSGLRRGSLSSHVPLAATLALFNHGGQTRPPISSLCFKLLSAPLRPEPGALLPLPLTSLCGSRGDGPRCSARRFTVGRFTVGSVYSWSVSSEQKLSSQFFPPKKAGPSKWLCRSIRARGEFLRGTLDYTTFETL